MRIQKLNYQSKIWKNTQNYVFQEKKWAYYLTRIVELAFCVGFMIIRTDFLTRILLLIVLIIPIRGLIFPMSLIANDKGITIWGFGNSKEPLFMEWREIRTVVLQHNNILGSILLYRKVKGQPMEEICLDLQRFCDISDELFTFPKYNNRIREGLSILCKRHGVSFRCG